MTLDTAKPGDRLRVVDIPDPDDAMVAMRLGLMVGEVVTLAAKLPGGPLVLHRGQMEIALGRDLCQRIACEPATGVAS